MRLDIAARNVGMGACESPCPALDTGDCGSREAPENMQNPTRPAEARLWFCVQSHRQAERWADENLRQQGYETLFPTHDVRVRDRVTRTMTHIVERPYLPGYLFVRFDRDRDPWGPICHTRGVKRLFVSADHRPVPVPSDYIDRLIADAPSRRILRADAGAEDLTGERLRISEGAFAEYEGLCAAGEKERVRVFITLMGREVAVDVDRRIVEKIKPPEAAE